MHVNGCLFGAWVFFFFFTTVRQVSSGGKSHGIHIEYTGSSASLLTTNTPHLPNTITILSPSSQQDSEQCDVIGGRDGQKSNFSKSVLSFLTSWMLQLKDGLCGAVWASMATRDNHIIREKREREFSLLGWLLSCIGVLPRGELYVISGIEWGDGRTAYDFMCN